MDKVKSWFLNLSRIGKMSIISAATLGTIAVGASNPPAEPIQPAPPAQPVVTTETKEESKPILFEATQREDSTVSKGTTYIETVGVNGVETLTHTITLKDGVETARKTTSKISTAPVNQVTVVGTYVAPSPPPPVVSRSCDPNYSGCVPIVSYDLDCPDIGFAVTVLGVDTHGFDGNDNDGYGCESY